MPELPPVIAAYFAAEPDADAAALRTIFAADARVTDEGASHAGIDAICRWRGATFAATPFVARPVDAETSGDTTLVRVEVSGAFPNSPVMLPHRFTLTDGRIATLDIG